MFQVIDIKKSKTNGSIVAVARHNLRQVSSKNIDEKRANLNQYLVGKPPFDVLSAVDARLKTLTKTPRKDSVKTLNIVLSASPEYFKDKQAEEAWKKASMKWISDTFGAENVVYAVLHKDEMTPHLHVCLTPIIEGRLSAAYWVNGKEKLRKLHDSLAAVMKPLGLRRGLRTQKTTHKDLKRFYNEKNRDAAVERNIDKQLEQALEKAANPSLFERLSPLSLVNRVIPLAFKALSSYRAKAKKLPEVERKLKEAKEDADQLARKLISAGIDPELSKDEIKRLYFPAVKALKDSLKPQPKAERPLEKMREIRIETEEKPQPKAEPRRGPRI